MLVFKWTLTRGFRAGILPLLVRNRDGWGAGVGVSHTDSLGSGVESISHSGVSVSSSALTGCPRCPRCCIGAHRVRPITGDFIQTTGHTRVSQVATAVRRRSCESRCLLYGRTRFQFPNIPGIFADRAVARKFARTGDIENDFCCPGICICIKCAGAFVSFNIRSQVCQMHVEVPTSEEHVQKRSKYAWLVPAEMIGGNQV